MSLRDSDVPVPVVLKGAPPPSRWSKDCSEQYKAALQSLQAGSRDVPVPAVLKGAPPSREPLRDGEWSKDRLEQFKAAFAEPLERAPGLF